MTKYLVEEQTLTDIANAIREQTGDENPIMLSNFASEISSIQGGGSVNYSTTEHEVGTWVDGSTVYEKTVFDTFTNGSTRLDISFGIGSNNISIISIEGVFFQLGSPLSSPFNASTPSEASYSIKSVEGYSLYADNGIRIERQNAQAYGSTPTVYVTIRYIKAST